MLRRNGFTMVELMIVIVIVAILASVGIPMLRSRVERAKYTEAMAGCSAIATALKAEIAEKGQDSTFDATSLSVSDLGFTTYDLQGKYFGLTDYSLSVSTYVPSTGELAYTITAAEPSGTGHPTLGDLVLNQDGDFTLDGKTF